MKKPKTLPVLIIFALIGISIWLVRGTDAKHITRQDVTIDVPDTFQK
ncbi:MAG: hypothetical protein JKX72_07180 [Robiginitomaculum sp.]|nr:hypothetical protein [Robiginitomaculum sp.]